MFLNAFKLTPVGGVTGIGIRRTKTWVKIDIANSGAEIDADDLPYVFCALKLQEHDNATGPDGGCMSRGEFGSCI